MSKELDYIADLEKENRLLGERCNQLLKDKGYLTDQIADIKANCDFAIEGRDIKIKELELELTVQKDQLTKAKEHIRTLISCLIDWVQEGDKDYCYIADAEQFLKEIEK